MLYKTYHLGTHPNVMDSEYYMHVVSNLRIQMSWTYELFYGIQSNPQIHHMTRRWWSLTWESVKLVHHGKVSFLPTSLGYDLL
jgi:hypothetical protein